VTDPTATILRKVTEEADKLGIIGGLSLDVIWKVVGVGAREGLAAGERSGEALWEHHLDSLMIIRLNDSRNIKVSDSVPTIESDLAQHARNIGGAFRNRVPVSNPTNGEGDLTGSIARKDERVNCGKACVGG